MTSGAPPSPVGTAFDAPTPTLLRAFAQTALAMQGELDQATLLTTALDGACTMLGANGASFWTPNDGDATCRLAVGAGADALRGTTVTLDLLDGGDGTIAAPVVAGTRAVGYLRVAHIDASTFTPSDREILTLLGDATGRALTLATRMKASDRADDIKLVQEMSREIGSSLDLDRVLQTTVNIAARALEFDVGALALFEDGKCDIRALAGASTVDAGQAEMQDLSFRAAWAAGQGEVFYLSDRDDPGSDTERIFLQFFSQDLETADARSGLYLPLRDEEGIVGILLFESKHAEFADARARDIAMILANQATVAIRNAKLYSQVPLAEALGAFSAKRRAFFAIPQRKRIWAAAVGVAVIGALTLIRWPLRVVAEAPTFAPTAFADARPLAAGIVGRVLVHEGDAVAAGATLAQLDDIEARAARESAAAALRAAEREGALATSRSDAAAQRLQAIRESSARAELALRDEALGRLAVRAPVAGVVLTARPELLQGTQIAAGAPFLRLGRTDTLELEFGVEQHEVERVHAGEEVRLRLDGIPGETFAGRVSMVGALPLPSDPRDVVQRVLYPVRATVPNERGLLRAGMAAHARVLTAPASLASRMLRTPIRNLRLLWWRTWSWL